MSAGPGTAVIGRPARLGRRLDRRPARLPGWAELDRGAVATRDIGQQLDHLLADPGQVGPQLHQHLGGHPFALTDEAEQDVLGADVVVTELQRLAQRQLEHLLARRVNWRWPLGDDPP